MTDKTELIPIAKPYTEEWYDLRNTGLGSSDAAGAVGLSKYSNPLEVYSRKVGDLPEFEGNEATDFGTFMEPGILKLWEKKTGETAIEYPCPMYRSAEHPYMIATPDAQLSPTAGVEIKSLTWRLLHDLPERDGCELTSATPDYIMQAQHQMAVTGWEIIYFAILVERSVKCFRVPRNERLIQSMIEAEQELWQRIENKDPPEPNWEHPRTPALIKDLFNSVKDEICIELSPEGAESWKRARQAGRLIKALEARKEAERAKVLAEIGDHYAGVLPGKKKMVRRSEQKRSGHIVKPFEFVDCREVNYQGNLITVDDAKRHYEEIDALMKESGYYLKAESTFGSRYYVALGYQEVRVSDHKPNSATLNWMNREDVFSLRVDGPGFDAAAAVTDLLEERKALL